jgi:hypothetical protein
MQKAHRKHVFYEVEVASIAFRAMLHEGRVLLHVEDASGRESEVPLMGSGMPSLFYGEAWTVRGRDLGSGWSLCYDRPREPLMCLGGLSDSEVLHLIREFGLHVDFSPDVVTFPESAAARSLKQIIAKDPERAALFRKNANWLNAWLSKAPPEALPHLSSRT